MSFYNKIYPYLKNPQKIYARSALKRLQKLRPVLSKEEYIKRKFKIDLGYDLNLESPKTFNEKMQWLKFFNQQSVFVKMASKHEAKEYVSNIIGSQYVAKEYGCWDNFDEIDFSKLPQSFVLKTTHGCGSVYVCKNKENFDPLTIKQAFENSIKTSYYENYFEWPYRDIKRQIIAEEFLSDGSNNILPVFKFFCFDGKPFIAQIIKNDKQDNETIDYIDMDYNFLKLSQGYPNNRTKNRLPKPKVFEEMKNVASKLSKGLPFIRVDLYDCGNRVMFSEFTFYSDAGFARFFPKKWDLRLGNEIKLPDYKIIENVKYED